jgi:GMP synthase-like glutamine amidotransferase
MKVLLIYYFDSQTKILERRLKEYGISYDAIPKNELTNYLAHTTPDLVFIPGTVARSNIKKTDESGQIVQKKERDLTEIEELLKLKKTTIIGLCFGFQSLARVTGGKLRTTHPINHRGFETQEYKGKFYDVWYNHFDRVIRLPSTWDIKMRFDDFIAYATMARGRIHGFQFHPEKRRETFDAFILPIIHSVQKRLTHKLHK